MARDDPPRLIPTADRGREQIAARYTSRMSRLYGASEGNDALPVEPDVYPFWLSFEEVIGLIAFGRITALSGPAPCEQLFFERWKSKVTGGPVIERRYPLVYNMRWVIARVRWWQSRKRLKACHAFPPLKPLDNCARANVRWALRHHQATSAVTLDQLRADVRQLYAARLTRAVAIERTTTMLCADIAAENITAWGRPGIWRKRQFTSGIHEPIKAVFFANPHNTIRLDGWATCADSVTMAVWANWSGPDWGDLTLSEMTC